MKLLLIVFMLLITGCATNKEYAAYLAAVQASSVAQSEAFKARAAAMEKIATSSMDSTSRTVAAMMLGTMQAPTTSFSPPPQSEWLEAAKVFLPPLAYLGGTFIATDAAKYSAQMSRDVAISTNSAFLGMGGQIASGFAHIQAPGAVTNTTTTTNLSGQGVIGNGTYNPTTNTYTNSYNTTRTCNAGNGGGTTTGAPGGAANC